MSSACESITSETSISIAKAKRLLTLTSTKFVECLIEQLKSPSPVQPLDLGVENNSNGGGLANHRSPVAPSSKRVRRKK